MYIWFHQQRGLNIPVNGSLLQEKASILFEKLHLDTTTKEFTASVGFQWRFCKRNGKTEKKNFILNKIISILNFKI